MVNPLIGVDNLALAIKDDDEYEVTRQSVAMGVTVIVGIVVGKVVAGATGGGKGGKTTRGPPKAPKAAKLPRLEGTKPRYHVNDAHVPGSGKYVPGKEPLPADAADVFKTAVPDAAHGAKNWYGKNSAGVVYRFSNANDGTVHFSGSSASKDGIRNMTEYARQRLGL